MAPLHLLPALVLFSTLQTSFSLSIPSFHVFPKRADAPSSGAAGRVSITYDHVDNPIQVPNDIFNPGDGSHNLDNPQIEIQRAADRGAEMATAAREALGRAGIETTPEFRIFFGTPSNIQNAIETLRELFSRVSDIGHFENTRLMHFDLRNTPPSNEVDGGHTFASADGDQITVFQDFWTVYQSDRRVVPAIVAELIDLEGDLDGLHSWASILLHEMIHIVGNDDPAIPVLHTQTNPPEVSDVNGILQMAISDPDHAILNPESLANFAIAIYYNGLARQAENDNYPQVTYPVNIVHVPDPFDQLSNITSNTYDIFNDPAPVGFATWWLFKGDGSIPDNFLK